MAAARWWRRGGGGEVVGRRVGFKHRMQGALGAGFLTLLLLLTPNYAMEESSAAALIPMRLSQREREVYEKLIRVVEKRKKNGLRPRPIVVITDVGKDYDDLAALVVLTEFHRLGLIELRAVVANLMPARKRARFARAVLDSLGLPHVPVACGTPGSPEDHEEFKHELEGNEVEYSGGGSATPKDVPMEEGHHLLLEVYKNALVMGEKLHLLCLSSLQDIEDFASTHEVLVKECTADVHMQGGNYISDSDGSLKPDSKAANNRFNLDAAERWHSFIQKAPEIPSHTYSKSAAFTAPLTSDVFVKLEETGHRVGAYLRRVQVEQDLAFYKRACESDPEKRFAPFMDQKWFLGNKTNWHQRPDASNEDALPTGEEVIPYLTKIVLYDVHAALGIVGCDVVKELNVDESRNREDMNHSITDDKLSLEHKDDISLTVSSLLKGSLNFHAKVGVSSEASRWKDVDIHRRASILGVPRSHMMRRRSLGDFNPSNHP